jgi:hypothetical protein
MALPGSLTSHETGVSLAIQILIPISSSYLDFDSSPISSSSDKYFRLSLTFHTLSCILLSPDDLSLITVQGLYFTYRKHAIPNPRCSVLRGFHFCCSNWYVHLPITRSITSFPSTHAKGWMDPSIHSPTHSTKMRHESALTYIQHKQHKHNPTEKLQPCQTHPETSSLSTLPVSLCVS